MFHDRPRLSTTVDGVWRVTPLGMIYTYDEVRCG